MPVSVPNLISFARLLAVPVAIYLILIGELGWAFWLFVAAGVSDGLDGFIARVFQARTQLGAYLDPIADKALLVSVFITLGHQGYLPIWLVILVVFRDVMIIGGVLLLYTLKESLAMQPLFVSKVNTLAQILLVGSVLAAVGLGIPDPRILGVPTTEILVWTVALMTALSGAIYVARAANALSRLGGVK